MTGKVYLVGAGPGDPELLTIKGRRALERASVVLYDHLAPEQLLDLAPGAAERIYVGKKRASHALSQEQITALLIARAAAGAVVVRLKGGDPYLFGRGGEEAEALADAGIPWEVIPGVTSPAGIAAYAGVPLTHRDHASAVSIVTGHDIEAVDWPRLGLSETLIVLMGLTNFDAIAARIIAAGRDPETPAIAVRWGTRPDQVSIGGTLATLPALIQARGLKPPATVIVGEVARLHPKLNWFEKLPLFGQRVVVTRPRGQSSGLVSMLRDLGAQAVEFPTISISPASDYAPLDGAIAHLDEYDWLVFTSVNGVDAFFARLDRSTADLRRLRARLAAIGPATREALERAHLKVDVTGDEYVAESLAAALERHPVEGRRILFVRAAAAREFLPQALSARGALVEIVEAYRTVPASGIEEHARALEAQPPQWITFTSSSTVDNFYRVVDPAALRNSRVASIGPVTSATLRKFGIEPHVEARVFTVEGLVAAILRSSAPQ